MKRFTVTVKDNESGETFTKDMDGVHVKGVVRSHVSQGVAGNFTPDELVTFITNHTDAIKDFPRIGDVGYEIAVNWSTLSSEDKEVSTND